MSKNNSSNQDLITDLIVRAGLTADDDLADLLLRASDAVSVAETKRQQIIQSEIKALDELAREVFNNAHGLAQEDWEPEARRATRYMIASEILSARLEKKQ